MSIVRDVAGFVDEDDFDRANSSTVGGDWIERAGDWSISSNDLVVPQAGAHHIENDAGALGEMFVQAQMRVNQTDSSAAIWARFTWNGGSDSGYLLFIVPASDVIRIQNRNNGSFGANVDEAKSLAIDTWYPSQFYVANAVQEGWVDGTTVNATQTVHDDEDARGTGFRVGHASSINRTTRYNDFIWCRSKNIVVTGLPTGWKAKVRNSGGSVVATATESGGTATIDASRFGGATEIVPIGGWTDLIVTDSGDTIQETYNANTVYPGDEYTFSGAGVLTVEDLTVGSSFDEPALVQANTLAPEDMAVASVLDEPTLITDIELAPEALTVASTLEAPTLLLNVLAPEDLTVASTLDGDLALTQANVLAPEDMVVASVLDAPTLVLGDVVLTVEDLIVASTLDEPALVKTYLLSPEDLTVASSIEVPTVLQNALKVEDLTVATTIDLVVFVFTTEGIFVLNGVAYSIVQPLGVEYVSHENQVTGANGKTHAAVNDSATSTNPARVAKYTITFDRLAWAAAQAVEAELISGSQVTIGGDALGGVAVRAVVVELPSMTALQGDGHFVELTAGFKPVQVAV